MRSITSAANPTIRSLAKLLDRRHREREGRFIIEGRRESERALAAGIEVEVALVVPQLGAEAPPGVDTIHLSEQAFRRISVRDNPDGHALVARLLPTGIDRIEDSSLVLVSEGAEKPGNIGAMLRTADAAGAAVVLADPVADLGNPNVVRASQGSLFAVPVAVVAAAEGRRWLLERMAVLVARPDAVTSYWDADLALPTAFVIGAEHEGVSATWDGLPAVTIPMRGAADSLNASVTAALLLFEAVRQRSGG